MPCPERAEESPEVRGILLYHASECSAMSFRRNFSANCFSCGGTLPGRTPIFAGAAAPGVRGRKRRVSCLLLSRRSVGNGRVGLLRPPEGISAVFVDPDVPVGECDVIPHAGAVSDAGDAVAPGLLAEHRGEFGTGIPVIPAAFCFATPSFFAASGVLTAPSAARILSAPPAAKRKNEERLFAGFAANNLAKPPNACILPSKRGG